MSDAFEKITIVLARPSHPGNIGAAARAMKTMGLKHLVLVRPEDFPSPVATARAAGAEDILAAARVVDDLPAALVGTRLVAALTARVRELSSPMMWARQAATRLTVEAQSQPVALVFGNETSGLSNEEISLCHFPVMVPVNPAYRSLNLAAAVQIMAYELRMALLDPGLPPPTPGAGLSASHEEIEGLIEHLQSGAIASGFLDPASPKRLIPRLRRLFARAVLEKEEVAILRGLLAALQKPK
ncbi:MAG: hypothetical protein RIR70_1181 [Pseudomonadota bacterium]